MYDPRQMIDEHLPHVLVVRTRLPKGDAWWVPSEDAIVVDDRLDPIEERCAIAHEVEHAVAADVPVDLLFFSRKQEQRANRRADRKLVELADLVDQLLWCRNHQSLRPNWRSPSRYCSADWRVSPLPSTHSWRAGYGKPSEHLEPDRTHREDL